MRRIAKSALQSVAPHRRAGYVDAVMGSAVQQDATSIWLADETYEELRRAFALPNTGPSFFQKVKNFTKAAVQHVASGMPLASEEEINRRFAICQTCPFLKDGACTKCGCPVNREKKFISKLAWADQKCPVGHW